MAKVLSTLAVRKRRDAKATHEALLKAARAMMAESGPEALTVSEVAHRAGVNRTTAYQHFRAREDLMGAVLAQVADETSLMLKTDLSPSQLLDSMTEYFLEHPEIARLWMFQMLQNIQLPNRDGWNRYMKAMRALAASERAQPGIDPEMLGTILLAAVLVWPLRVRSRSEGDADATRATHRFTRELKRLLLFGALQPQAWPDLLTAIATTPDAIPTPTENEQRAPDSPSKASRRSSHG